MSAERRAVAKATKRLIPFLFGIYIVAYLDRVNVSFAQLQLEDDLGFSDTIFGLGAGIFSLGYVIFGMPSNILLERFGARRWLSAIMIAWGLLSASMLFIEGKESFYLLRFLLGVAEAGFFPGIVLYLTWWFPEADRGRTLALFMTAISASYVIGGPLSGGLLELDGVAGLEGWQWLFLCEGLPAVALGFVALRFLDDRPADAEWLEPDEKEALTTRIEGELQGQGDGGAGRPHPRRAAQRAGVALRADLLHHPLGCVRADVLRARPRAGAHRPERLRGGRARGRALQLRDRGHDRLRRHGPTASGQRRMYVIGLMLLGAAGTVLTAYASTVILLAFSLTLSTVGLLAVIPIFWSLPTGFLTGSAAAAGIGAIAAIGNLGGFGGPAFTGAMEDSTGDFVTPFIVLAGLLVVGCLLTLLVREPAATAAAGAARARPEAAEPVA